MQNKYLATVNFDEKALKLALNNEVSRIIYVRKSISNEKVPENMRLFSALKYNTEGGWYAYNENKKRIEQIKKKSPHLFKYKDYDLTSAYLKLLLWLNYSDGLLNAFIENEKIPIENVIFNKSNAFNSPIHKLKQMLFLLKLKAKFKKKKSGGAKASSKGFILFYENDKSLEYLGGFLDFFSKEELQLGFVSEGIKKTNMLNSLVFNDSVLGNSPKFSLFNAVSNLYAYRILTEFYVKFSSFIDELEKLVTKKTKGFVLIAGENSHWGHLISEVAHKNRLKKILVFNLMNGAKGATANNADVKFDFWFVWSKKMREMLIKNYDYPQQMLVPIDHHLMEDVAFNFRFQNLLGFKNTEDKIVVSFFIDAYFSNTSSKVIQALIKFVKDNGSKYFLVFRPHPVFSGYEILTEMISPLHKDNFMIINSMEKSEKVYLYEQLYISDISIVIASTVAYEALWFKNKVITFEESENSILLDVDGENFIHENIIEDLIIQIKNMHKKEQHSFLSSETVAEKYVNFIKSKASDEH